MHLMESVLNKLAENLKIQHRITPMNQINEAFMNYLSNQVEHISDVNIFISFGLLFLISRNLSLWYKFTIINSLLQHL